jgi:transposase
MDTAARRAEVARLYIEGVPAAVIAAQLGVRRKLVQEDAYRLRKAGVELARQTGRRGPRTRTPVAVKAAVAMLEAGSKRADIAQVRGITLNAVDNLISKARKLGLLPPSSRRSATPAASRHDEPRRRAERVAPEREVRKTAQGKRPCMCCRQVFLSPDVSRIRLCTLCKSSAADALPMGW